MVTEYRALRIAALVFSIGFAIHGVDHAIRGFDPVPTPVVIGGNIQTVLVIVAVGLVYLGHRWAPGVSAAVALGSIVGFSAAHLLPTWGSGWFSDSFVTPVANSGVTWFSWVTVFTEMGTALMLAAVALRTLRARRAASVPEPVAAG